jgi:hypothetical protein
MNHVQDRANGGTAGSASSRQSQLLPRVKLIWAGALAVAVVMVAGCGSAAVTPSSGGESLVAMTVTKPAGSAVTRNAGDRPTHPASDAASRKGYVKKAGNGRPAPPRITNGPVIQRPAAGTGGDTVNDDNPSSKASRADAGGRPTIVGKFDPCQLVSASQARAITGHAITVKEAPLGPTCIYHEVGTSASVTMAVETIRVASVVRHLKTLSRVQVGSRTGYCVVAGNTVTYLALSGNRGLVITAPCAQGAKFAAVASPKLR